jgi:rhamnosyltransferase
MSTQFLASPDYAIGLVTYYPEESLLKRINLMEELGFKVYIFDNSAFAADYSRVIQTDPNCTYLTAGKNVGIGFALATLCATAFAHGYQHLLFLDQDTGISRKTLEFINASHKSLSIITLQKYALIAFNGQISADSTLQEVRLAISSGSLFNLPLIKKIGWHNHRYFVDCVDYELCVRARRYGLKIGLIKNTPDFDHVTEQPDQSITVLGKQVLVRRYSLSRITDALGAYLKLIAGGIFTNRLSDTLALVKSAVIYIVNQLISRFIKQRE